MLVLASEIPGWNLPAGLWPVYVAGATVLICFVVFVMASVLDGPPQARRRLRRGSLLLSLPFALLAAGLYAYADSRYQHCLADGNHPWWVLHAGVPLEEIEGVCDRAVVGDVLVRKPN